MQVNKDILSRVKEALKGYHYNDEGGEYEGQADIMDEDLNIVILYVSDCTSERVNDQYSFGGSCRETSHELISVTLSNDEDWEYKLTEDEVWEMNK